MDRWTEDKRVGDFVEEHILDKYFIKKYPNAHIDDIGKANSDWDIWIPELNYGVEVKSDFAANETGNLVIEVEMNNKLSALSVTKAKYWVFVEGNRYIWVTPLEIYRFIEQNFKYGRVHLQSRGDKATKKAYLVSRDEFTEYVLNLDKISGSSKMINQESIMHWKNFEPIMEQVKSGEITYQNYL